MKPKTKTNVSNVSAAPLNNTNDVQVYLAEIIQEIRKTNALLSELLTRTPKRISGTDLVN